MLRRLIAALLCLGLCASNALAQPTDPVAEAERLFDEGRALLDANRAGEACPKFEESQRLDPGLGTLLNLAACYEAVGKLASAWKAFREAEAQAKAAGETKREEVAAERATELEPRVPRLIVETSGPDLSDGITITIDGVEQPAASLGTAVAQDPGTLTVVASATGYDSYQEKIKLAADGKTTTITIPTLAKASGAKVVMVDGKPVIIETERRRSRVRTIAGVSIAGVGAVLFGGSIVLALGAKSNYDTALDQECGGNASACSELGVVQTDAARRRGNQATVVGAIGLAAIAGGLVLWLTAPTEEVQSTALTPQVGADSAGVVFVGSF